MKRPRFFHAPLEKAGPSRRDGNVFVVLLRDGGENDAIVNNVHLATCLTVNEAVHAVISA